jgi:hypothetical protein
MTCPLFLLGRYNGILLLGRAVYLWSNCPLIIQQKHRNTHLHTLIMASRHILIEYSIILGMRHDLSIVDAIPSDLEFQPIYAGVILV